MTKTKTTNLETIFIQIASYRDEELPKTIQSCLENAKHPERLYFGIFNQYGPETQHSLDKYKNNSHFRIKQILWRESRGLGIARNTCETMYQDETFTLQIDSHMRFKKDWDDILVKEWHDCQLEKAILTGYPPEYKYENNQEVLVEFPPSMMYVKEFYKGYIPRFDSRIIPKKITKPYRVCFASGGFMFCRGKVCQEVPHLRDISFIEEITHSLRLFTHGYRMFCPTVLPIYHLYLRSKVGAHFFWGDFHNDPQLGKQNIYQQMEDASDKIRRRVLLDGDPTLLGTANSYEDFQNYCGLNFKEKLIHPDQVKGLEPPYATNSKWLDTFFPIKNIPVSITLPMSDFSHEVTDYDFWYFSLRDENETELIRDDIHRENWEVEEISFHKTYPLRKQPKKYIVWPHSRTQGWLERKVYDL